MKTLSRFLLSTLIALSALFFAATSNAEVTLHPGSIANLKASGPQWSYGTNVSAYNSSDYMITVWIDPEYNSGVYSDRKLLFPGEAVTFHTNLSYNGLNISTRYFGGDTNYVTFVKHEGTLIVYNPSYLQGVKDTAHMKLSFKIQ